MQCIVKFTITHQVCSADRINCHPSTHINTTNDRYKGFEGFLFNPFAGDAEVNLHYYFGKPMVLLNDAKLMKKVLKTESYRESVFCKYEDTDSVSCFDLNNQLWQRGRKLNLRCLTKIFCANNSETVIHNLLQNSLFKSIDSQIEQNGNIYKCRQDIQWTIFSSLFCVFYGVTDIDAIPQKTSNEYIQFVRNIEQIFSKVFISFLLNAIPLPFVHKYCYDKLNDITGPVSANKRLLQKWYDSSLKDKTVLANSHNNYFECMARTQTSSKYSQVQMIADLTGLYAAGLHSSSLTVEIILYLLCKHSNIQEMVHSELKQNKSEHLLRAFIYESMRLYPVFELTLLRQIRTSECRVGKYNIPKNALMFGNIAQIHRKKKYWGNDANSFCIDHFLDKNQKFRMNPAFVSFGAGRRNCVGGNIAKKNIFSIVSALILRYKFEIPKRYYQKRDEFKVRTGGAIWGHKEHFLRVSKRLK